MQKPDIRNFDVANWQDESRVDRLCTEVLRHFHQDLLTEQGCAPLEAGGLARAADYFLREFIIGDRQDNIFEIIPNRVRQFAGNWYIIKNMEPNMEELTDLLLGVDAFYSWCADNCLCGRQQQTEIQEYCRAFELYRERIKSFWEITDNYSEWDAVIRLRD